ncbi:putative inositol polyphosphate 1-phosphatase [Trypanosoma theileri]|uniref:3'(2'),5'-bisphosphate nucleotidase n=1 Tax=Trypanosoma theileri TaxID=67003 RepID=A0A1X0NIY3_9TRYP|nr:putative inositol polyphosphate 1-phosphatase [Trypanosoma theileri]ORC84488.1 putative inositol polyphosphate 1-phosphatase [Trypanosoma theileri]
MTSVNLLDVLMVCVRGALAAQRYIALQLLQLDQLQTDTNPQIAEMSIVQYDAGTRRALLAKLRDAVQVEVKEHLHNKKGNAAKDLVTTADVVTQAVLECVLRTAFPTVPFTLVGEEEGSTAAQHTRMGAAQCIATHYNTHEAIPQQAELEAHVPLSSRIVTAKTSEELRRRVGVFIDPIDGTNCFVEGCWEVPLTLVGITLDGVPIAAVVNRVFHCNAEQLREGYSSSRSLSYVWNRSTEKPFIVHEGKRVSPLVSAPRPVTTWSTLRVVCSNTTRDSVFTQLLCKLQPFEKHGARGAGNKLMLIFSSMISGSSQRTSCDVFLSPANSIKTWDTCAPHAFLLALGGELYTLQGEVIRYQLIGDRRTKLPAGVVGVSCWSKTEVPRRMRWSHSNM